MSVAERTPEETARIRNWAAAYAHWSQIGFTHQTAAALASVRHGQDQDTRTWARAYMLQHTNMREEDML